MMEFIKRLEEWNLEDPKLRAVLRRSLAFDPGQFPSAFPYIERFINGDENSWRRDMHYLVAGLWAAHWKSGREETKMTIGSACAKHMHNTGSTSTEQRFIALIDSDSSQLPHRLRQMISLLRDYPIDFAGLLKGLLYWNSTRKSSQHAWARDFYRVSSIDDKFIN